MCWTQPEGGLEFPGVGLTFGSSHPVTVLNGPRYPGCLSTVSSLHCPVLLDSKILKATQYFRSCCRLWGVRRGPYFVLVSCLKQHTEPTCESTAHAPSSLCECGQLLPLMSVTLLSPRMGAINPHSWATHSTCKSTHAADTWECGPLQGTLLRPWLPQTGSMCSEP